MHPEPLPGAAGFRALSELDAERSELFLARAALLVEGRTEKLTLPFVFRALGHDPDRARHLDRRVRRQAEHPALRPHLRAARVPFVALHDRDAPAGQASRSTASASSTRRSRSSPAPEHVVVLTPDFEGVAGLRAHSHKPEHAWERFSALEPGDVPGAAPPRGRARPGRRRVVVPDQGFAEPVSLSSTSPGSFSLRLRLPGGVSTYSRAVLGAR